ncbi:hypothetical protein Scep_002112 [Stephania cephalantha]|uniref:Uncharacterized protein n=1 Tax=Stephania cephalantha TaxID=152367 RepID=A0AAP0L9N9_9MAGN
MGFLAGALNNFPILIANSSGFDQMTRDVGRAARFVSLPRLGDREKYREKVREEMRVRSIGRKASWPASPLLCPVTLLTSNKPYSVSDGSNPFFDGRAFPKFNLRKSGVHKVVMFRKGSWIHFVLFRMGKGNASHVSSKIMKLVD